MRYLMPTAAATLAALAALADNPDTIALPTPTEADSLVIDKASMTLSVFGHGGIRMCVFDVATGSHPGNKVSEGDMRTPEGHFYISEIVDASEWTHDFGDGLGEIEGCYGPWFMRLDTPGHTGIGIHGTHDPASLTRRASEGCIRLRNDHCDSLKRLVAVGTPVSIYPAAVDRQVNEIIEAERALLQPLETDNTQPTDL